jgi:FixJ family two-component response regulator
VESLTPREYEVLVLVVAGMLNKQIAYDLKMSENTVKTHRAHIMQKMQVESLADLVRLTEKVGILQQKG